MEKLLTETLDKIQLGDNNDKNESFKEDMMNPEET